MGTGGKYNAEAGLPSRTGKGGRHAKRSQIFVWGRFVETGGCHEYGDGGTAHSYVWSVRSMLNVRRGACPCIHVGSRRIRRFDACGYVKPFRKCGKRIPISVRVCNATTALGTLDGDGQRRFLVGTRKSHVRITGVTVGKIVDYGLKDSQNMGACMAPAAYTIIRNLEDFGRRETDYDRIITGDLGYVGQSILFDLVRKQGRDIKSNHMDCGMTIFDQKTQDTHAGGSRADVRRRLYPPIFCRSWRVGSGEKYCLYPQAH